MVLTLGSVLLCDCRSLQNKHTCLSFPSISMILSLQYSLLVLTSTFKHPRKQTQRANSRRRRERMTPGPEPNEDEQADNLERDQQHGGGGSNAPSHHPSAPPHELFDISTTADPSYIISLLRKLLPLDGNQNDELQGLAAREESSQRSQTGLMEGVAFSPVRNGVLSNSNGNLEVMETQHNDLEQCLRSAGDDGEACLEHPKKSAREEAWEESGCVLWDLAANKEHAEFMVQNLALEVLLANLKTSDSVRITEISLGIIGNLACHEDLMNRITFTDGLLEIIVDQVFSDDASCLCEACRLLASGLQGCQCAVWAKALQSEHILSRVLWIAENTLNPILIERAVTLFLAIMENQREVAPLLPNLMNLGLPSILVNLLAFEMGKLTSERTPERYPALDSILRAIEALSVIDDYSQEICSNKELLQMVMELVKIPEKIEFSSTCVTAAVLIANILADSTGLASDMSKDFLFFQSLLDLLPLTSDDLEARSALWSILARLLLQVQETEMSLLTLSQYVQMLVSRSDLIEDVLLDSEWDTSSHKHGTHAASEVKVNSRTTAIKLIVRVLNQWIVAKKDMSARQNDEESEERNHADDKDVQKLLDCCLKHAS